ncbi:hypothetical protein RAP66_03205 [Campylobacter jejuni]|uniref:hypothetical protein n=1 Tax=Campylobacter jejuni TaxID=197 RepID=UPI001DAD4A84|nr:hypothetical protein [Campylobacter jejuni]EDK9174665.1 hypothetical protein [Campylobacter jejuni]KAJ9782403.1 hypothetical protein QR362_08400 [Campylobacter jejuni]KAJ9798876.1 hypothetical protein QR342_01350 [Campylobacter jejuni]MCW1670094.1 hypothetical protein [Campylobacter jejuni]MDP8339292.1 hypothetical protein [Campylobacter jejuni]
MAFYNPQRVVFNPDTGVIQNAGKVGGVLYDIMSKSFDDKVKANKFQQEQDLRKQQMEFNQAMQNNQLLQNEFNNALALQKFDLERQRQVQDNALNWAKYKEDKDYNQKYLDYLTGKNSNIVTNKINNNSGFSIDANGNLSEPQTMRDVFSKESNGGDLYHFAKTAKTQNINLNDIYGFGDTINQKLRNTPFSNSKNLKQEFADKLKAEINLALVNITSGRMSNEDRHRLEELVKTDSFYFFDKYAKHDIEKAVEILYRVKNDALKKEYMDIWKTERYLKDRDNIEKYYSNMHKKLENEKAMIKDFINGGNILASQQQRVPLNKILSQQPQQQLSQDFLQQNNMITFR